MPTSTLMQKLRKDHAKQMKKMKPGTRNSANIKPSTSRPVTTAAANRNLALAAAVAKMKAVQKKFNDDRNARTVKVITKK